MSIPASKFGACDATAPVLDARALRVCLGSRTVLDDVSMAMPAGGLCALIGPNGAGKSTLLRALAGIVRPVSGEVRHDVRDIAYMPQDRTVHWNISVARVVALGRMQSDSRRPFARPSQNNADDAAAIDRAMARMDVRHLAHRPINEVSGGERARVLMARALAQETRVLLADEPAAGLDPAHHLGLFEHLKDLAGEGRAVLVALHDLSLAVRYADRVILLHQGRIAADGPPDKALSREMIAAVFGIDVRSASIDGVPVIVPMSPVAKPVASASTVAETPS